VITSADRYRGCLLGGAVGDALGAGVEFASLDEIRRRHGPAGVSGYVRAYGRLGAITDDPDVTLVQSGQTDHVVRSTQSGMRCTCPWYGKHKDTRGPCKHILATEIFRRS
jgi:hypothetical protein